MQALYRYIGPDIDVPAGDMGVGGREIGFLFGEYRRLKGTFENGVLTGKGFSYGGSRIRPEATGYGAVYYLENVLRDDGQNIKGKTIAAAGFGNVTWGICKKAAELGAKVVTLSGPDGYIYDPMRRYRRKDQLPPRNAQQRPQPRTGLFRQIRRRILPRRKTVGPQSRHRYAVRYAERRSHGTGKTDCC